MIALARWTQTDFSKKARETNRAQLITIPFSHYVEFARWTWELSKKAFDENAYLPGQHVLPVLALRLGGSERYLSSSSFVTAVGRDANALSRQDASKARSTAVPALVQPSGKVLADSWSIANESGLQPLTDLSVMKMYDEELGPLARQFAYCCLLKPENRKYWDGLLCHNQGWMWRFLYFFIGNALHANMSQTFGVGDSDKIKECENKIDALFERIATQRLLHKKGRYINGDDITVEDVALCSLAGPICLPLKYCAGEYNRHFAVMEATDAEYREKIGRYRNTEVGKYVMQFYDEYR